MSWDPFCKKPHVDIQLSSKVRPSKIAKCQSVAQTFYTDFSFYPDLKPEWKDVYPFELGKQDPEELKDAVERVDGGWARYVYLRRQDTVDVDVVDPEGMERQDTMDVDVVDPEEMMDVDQLYGGDTVEPKEAFVQCVCEEPRKPPISEDSVEIEVEVLGNK